MAASQEEQRVEDAHAGADASSTALIDLAPLDHQKILSMLPPNDLCTAVQVCKALAVAGDSDLVWRAVACSRWPAESVVLGDRYKSYRELTLDDNRHNTAWYYPLEHGESCTYIDSQDDGYYKCHLIGLQRPRDGSKEFRLFYDARGEDDLRAPSTSMLMLKMLLGPEADNSTVLGAIDADDVEEYVSKPGHFKGCLVWDARHAESIETALSIEEDDVGTGFRVVSRSLVFQYGCTPLAFADAEEPGVLDVVLDYTGAKLFKLHKGDDFEQLWRDKAVLTAKGAMGRQLAAEGVEEQRQRWADLPPGVKRRGSAWPGADGLGEWPKEQG